MKSTSLLVLILISFACTKKGIVFKEKEYLSKTEIRKLHKNIAILPFNYAMNKQSRRVIEKALDGKVDIANEQKTVGEKLQSILFEELKKSNLSVSVQPIAETNNLLRESNISHDDIRRLSKPELAQLLKVDAVVYADIFVNFAEQPDNPILDNIDKQQAEFTIEIYGQLEDDVVWKAQSIFSRIYFYDEIIFKNIIRQSLIPTLPYYVVK